MHGKLISFDWSVHGGICKEEKILDKLPNICSVCVREAAFQNTAVIKTRKNSFESMNDVSVSPFDSLFCNQEWILEWSSLYTWPGQMKNGI